MKKDKTQAGQTVPLDSLVGKKLKHKWKRENGWATCPACGETICTTLGAEFGSITNQLKHEKVCPANDPGQPRRNET